MKEAFEDTVKRFPDRETELRDAQGAWIRGPGQGLQGSVQVIQWRLKGR